MHGPVQHLRTVMWYLDMEITPDLRIHRVGRVPFQWLAQQDGRWGRLCVKVWWLMFKPVQPKSSSTEKTCQDLTTKLDLDASRALLLGKPHPGSNRTSQHSQTESETPRNPADAAGGPLSGLERHRPKTVLTSSVRTNHRLAAGIVESPGCKICGDCTPRRS